MQVASQGSDMGRKSRLKRERRSGGGTTGVVDQVEVRMGESRDKISRRLVVLVDPLMKEVTNLEETRTLLTLGVLAWNLAVEGDTAVSALGEMVETKPGLKEFVESLMERKRRLFPRDQRVVIDHDVSLTAGGSHYVRAVAVHT
jgi:hypothetical protein